MAKLQVGINDFKRFLRTKPCRKVGSYELRRGRHSLMG